MKKRVACFFTLYAFSLLISPERVFSQAAKADSLLKLATAIYNSMPDSSLFYCQEVKSISTKNNLKDQYAYSLLCEARYLLLKGDFKITVQKINEASKIFEEVKNTRGLAKCYSLKSIAMGRLNNPKERLQYLLKSKELYTSAKDTDGICTSSVNLANAYKDNGEYDKALTVLNDLKKLNRPAGINSFYVELNYGNVYLKQKNYTLATTHLQNAVKFAQENKMVDSEITALTHLAECYSETKKTTEAVTCYNRALDLARQNKLVLEERDALKTLILLLEENIRIFLTNF